MKKKITVLCLVAVLAITAIACFAWGYAANGWGYADILAHYYPGTTLVTQ